MRNEAPSRRQGCSGHAAQAALTGLCAYSPVTNPLPKQTDQDIKGDVFNPKGNKVTDPFHPILQTSQLQYAICRLSDPSNLHLPSPKLH